ncbi:hypothetical protein CRENBAI_012960, partial [Crenichthys baileyi]
TQGHTTHQQRPDRARGPRPCQAVARSETAYTRAPSSRHKCTGGQKHQPPAW